MGLDLTQVCERLQSDKVKERQEGLAAIREAFVRDHVVRNFDENRDGRAWLALFQALFATVQKERLGYIKNGTAVAERRLDDAARCVRWLVERSLRVWNKRVRKPLLAHLKQSLVHRGALLIPPALEYLKTLLAVLRHDPHADALDEAQWQELVSLAFAILLGKPLDMNLFVDDMEVEEEEEEDEFSTPSADTRKRSRETSTVPANKRRKVSAALTEDQIDAAAILRALFRLRYTPSSGPGLERILSQFKAFFLEHPTETTAHRSIMPALNLVLSRAVLNARNAMTSFGLDVWQVLLSLWSTKERSGKEAVLIAMQYLFPFIVEDESVSDDINKLNRLIDGEPDVRLHAVPVLSMDTLRLDVQEPNSFAAQTFCAGTDFTAGQALAWAALSLRADCLYQLHRAARTRAQDPTFVFLASLLKPCSAARRHFRLQTLLFLIERHWASLQDTLRADVISTLMKFLSHDDTESQVWGFLCFAAIAHSETTVVVDWDAVWNHAIRRVSVPAICRAACHLSHLLLRREGKVSPQRVLADIEALAKDINIQGPAFPHDSVCAFLVRCLSVASRDARLYRMQLEDQVLAWLSDTLTTATPGGRYAVRDVLDLLEGVCALSRRFGGTVIVPVMLPECAIVEVEVEARRTAPVREFMLHARLPGLKPAKHRGAQTQPDSRANDPVDASDLVNPRPRERKASSFLLKTLEALLPTLENPPLAIHIRTAVDFAVLALSFEASLELNGTRPTRRVVQAACKVFGAVRKLDLWKWTPAERASIMTAFELLVSAEVEMDAPCEILVAPGKDSGIEKQKLLALQETDTAADEVTTRRRLQKTIWRSADVQDEFGNIFKSLRDMLEKFLDSPDTAASVMEQDDDFAPSRSSVPATSMNDSAGSRFSPRRFFASSVVRLLSIAPMLQSDQSTPTRDKQLLDRLFKCDGAQLLQLGPTLCECIRSGALYLGKSNLTKLLERIRVVLLEPPTFAQDEAALLFIVQTLDSTIDIWISPNVAETDVASDVRDICEFMTNSIGNRTWRVRDRWAAFSAHCLDADPMQRFWSASGHGQLFAPGMPATSIVNLAGDVEVLVRTTALVANTRLLSIARSHQTDVFKLYSEVLLTRLSSDPTDFEFMISRIAALSNYMIVNSAVRRGPFWHLLEPLAHHDQHHAGQPYRAHIQSALEAVAQRLGMDRLSALFEAYALQLAHSFLTAAGKDFFCLSPQVLGYSGRKELAEGTFATAGPVLLLNAGSAADPGHPGIQAFARYCDALGMTVQQGAVECFSSRVGLEIAFFVDTPDSAAVDILPEQSAALYELALTRARSTGAEDPKRLLSGSVDGIVTTILRAMGDLDYSKAGTIVQHLALHPDGDRAVKTWNLLMQFRTSSDFQMHVVNLPSTSSLAVIRALGWLKLHLPAVEAESTIYHVLHQLLAAVSATPLLNEKLRVLHGLCLWVSLNSRKFARPALLRTLILGATVLLGVADLSRFAQSILAWAFAMYKASVSSKTDPAFPDAVSRMGRTAYSFSCEGHDPDLKALGVKLLDWLERQLEECAANQNIRDQAVTIIHLWPRRPHAQLVNLGVDGKRTDTLSTILRDPRLTSNKFRLVTRLRDFAQHGDYSTTTFSIDDFWKIKGCMPGIDRLRDEDVDAFGDLLFLSHAHVVPLTDEPSSRSSIAYRHRQATSRNPNANAKGFIVQALLSMLSTEDTAAVHLAYSTLRVAVPLKDAMSSLDRDKAVDKDEISFYMQFTPALRARSAQETTCLLTDPSYITSAANFSTWIRDVSVLLADALARHDVFWGQLSPLLQRDVSFAEEMFAVLIHASLDTDPLPAKDDKRSSVKATISEYFTLILRDPASAALVIRSVVRAVLHLRHFKPRNTDDVLAHEKWLDIDYDILARGAISCGAYTTALLFVELSAEGYQDRSTPAPPEDILYEVYSRIDEPDGFYGIKSKNVLGHLLRRFHHEREWDKAFQFHGATFEGSTGASDSAGIMNSLHSFGFNNLAMGVLQSPSSSLSDGSHTTLQIAWRADTWDLPEPEFGGTSAASLYRALRAVHCERNPQVVDNVISQSIRQEMARLATTGDENIVQVREISQTLMCLREVRLWRGPEFATRVATRDPSAESWASLSVISSQFDFRDLEIILATRMSLLRSARRREQRDQIGTLVSPFTSALIAAEIRCLVRISEAARDSRYPQIALNSIVRAQQLEGVHQDPSFDVAQELSSVLWLQKERTMAIDLLRDLVQRRFPDFTTPTEDIAVNKQRALILSRVGGWASEARLQKPVPIREQYFDPATSLLLANNYSQADTEPVHDPVHATIFYQCAIFAEHQYHTILDSSEIAQLAMYRQRKTEELKLLRRQQGSGAGTGVDVKQLARQTKTTQALLDQDSTQLKVLESTRDAFRAQAIEMFSRCLCASDEYDNDAAIRLLSIWTANFALADNEFHDVVQAAIERVPSRKFVFLAHQVSARLSMDTTDPNSQRSQRTLQALMWRICSEHPFHTLYQLFSLQRAAVAADVDASSSRRRSTSTTSAAKNLSPALLARANAAAELTQKLKNAPETRTRTLDIERLCQAFLEWAQYPLKDKPEFGMRGPKTVPAHLQIRSLRDVKVPITTVETPVDPTLRYDNLEYIQSYDTKFNTAGGINLPKIIDCFGSAGGKYKQLFKGEGEDDLRQDAVMEQVFQLCNMVLKRDPEAAKRKLSIRPYKVIPLSPKAGMLEFVTETTPLGEWLLQAHPRYYKDDLPTKKAQEMLKKISNSAYSSSEKARRLLAAFLEIRARCRPVMRFFFRERHKDPMAWFAMRLNYARSAATTSIVGYVLGLGDRHISNILIDKITGELVHIDLGIAFEQGTLLQIPETVPFRLTADMVDGLGTTGPEGVFRRCAEHTLRVLSDGRDVIKLVLEVFKHDPLHSWYAVVQLRKAQPDARPAAGSVASTSDRFGIGLEADSNPEVEAADRALSTVARKLDRSMSVESTVNELIMSAMDPVNLSRIFWGWNPQY